MACMIPHSLPGSSTASENQVHQLLKRLGDHCLVYYEPYTGNRHPDFIVIIPHLGVLIIEAKGWRREQLASATRDEVTFHDGKIRQRRPHPQRQAREYMRRFQRECGKHKWAELLLCRSGPHEGNFTFPFSYLVIHTQIGRAELEEGDGSFSEVFPPARNVTKDIFKSWARLNAAALESQLAKFFDPYWPTKITDSQLHVLKAIISPITTIDAEMAAGDELKTLDAKQEAVARQLGTGHRVIYGVAGSGKTIILIARAKFIGGAPSRRVLILCYNRYLAQHIRLRTQGYGNIETHTFHAWGEKNGVKFILKEPDEAHAARLLAVMRSNSARDAARFDAVLVDEAQLLQADWLRAAKLALKDPASEHSHLFVAGDGTQSVFRKRPLTWTEVGINARGRTAILKRNYRNTQEILDTAVPFAAPGDVVETKGPGDPTPTPECLRSGPAPEMIQLQSRENEVNCASALIQSWLIAGAVIRGRREALRPSEIAILYPHIPNRNLSLLHDVRDKVSAFTKTVVLDGITGKLADQGVRIVSIQRATGLQFRAVILIWTDLLPSNFADRDDRTLLYLGMTRAEDVLVILHSGQSKLVDNSPRFVRAKRHIALSSTTSCTPRKACVRQPANLRFSKFQALLRPGT